MARCPEVCPQQCLKFLKETKHWYGTFKDFKSKDEPHAPDQMHLLQLRFMHLTVKDSG